MNEWDALMSLDRHELFDIMERESKELADFQDWLSVVIDWGDDRPADMDALAMARNGNILNRLSISCAEDIIIELVRVRRMRAMYDNMYMMGGPWTELLDEIPFPDEYGDEPEPPSERWRFTIVAYVRAHYFDEWFEKEDLLTWGIDADHLDECYDMLTYGLEKSTFTRTFRTLEDVY